MSAETLEPSHELLVRAPNPWAALDAVTRAMAHARLVSLNVSRFGGGEALVKLRVEGLAPENAVRIADDLANSGSVSAAQVEHIFWRRSA
jgi:hypothetical protein